MILWLPIIPLVCHHWKIYPCKIYRLTKGSLKPVKSCFQSLGVQTLEIERLCPKDIEVVVSQPIKKKKYKVVLMELLTAT